jgi:hypothetical protein
MHIMIFIGDYKPILKIQSAVLNVLCVTANVM